MKAASLVALLFAAWACAPKNSSLVVGSKPFTESEIAGEIVALLAEAGGAKVERKFYIGGMLCFESLKSGAIDVYVEYTGTGLVNILKEPADADPDKVYRRVQGEFQRRWDLIWLPPLGFNNTYALVLRQDQAKKLGISKISQLAQFRKKLRCGFDLEFSDRPDGYRGLLRHYGSEFCREIKQMSPGLMYSALAKGHVDVISGYATDGRIQALNLIALQDDLHFFPPYDAAPLMSQAALRKAPGLAKQLETLAGRLSDEQMRALNAEVDEKKRSPREVARRFLKSLKL